MRITATRSALLATLVAILLADSLSAATAQDVGDPTTPLLRTVRCSEASLCALLEEGRRRSHTLGALLSRLAELNGMVYLAWTPGLPSPAQAALMQRVQVTSDGMRCLWIVLHRRNHVSPALIPVMAHELQHAIELLESGAITSADIESFFKQIILSPGRANETAGAQRVERQVEKELQQQR